MRRSVLAALLLTLTLSVVPIATVVSGEKDVELKESITWTSGDDFSVGTVENVQVKLDGDGAVVLGKDPSFRSEAYAPFPYFGIYTSDPVKLAGPVNYVEASWEAREPAGTQVQVSVRGSTDGQKWSVWSRLAKDRGLPLDAPAATLQYKVTLLSQEQGNSPALLSLSSRAGIALNSPVPATFEEEVEDTEAPVFRVYATREGLVGGRTANGHIIKPLDRFVALPFVDNLSSNGGHEYQVLISYNGRRTIAPVWDIGPWNTRDNYWDLERMLWKDLPRGMPQAQAAFFDGYNDGKDERGRRVTIPAGIDIADGTFWEDLGMVNSDWVDVTFLWLGDMSEELEVPESSTSPTDPVEPILDNPDVLYFAQTGHNVGYEFLKYWQENGGVRVFGLPLTDGVKVGEHSAQYFERARFEFRADRPDGDKVVLGKLGSILSADKDFPTVEPFESSNSHRYFPDTQHSLSNGFLRFWLENGGEEMFGQPISEEIGMVSAETGEQLVVQYFERARFEYHPSLQGTPFEIQLGLLGRELLQRKGWLK